MDRLDLEEDGHRVLVQAWGGVPRSNWIRNMQTGTRRAARTIVVLSPDYLEQVYESREWQAAWAHEPDDGGRKLLMARVESGARPGLFASVVSLDLFGISEATARTQLRRMTPEH